MHVVSQTGLALIQDFEGFRAEPAQLPDGNWVVGFSHVRVGEAGGVVSETEAADLLALDVAPIERALNKLVTSDVNQNQFDALTSFAFSIGLEAFEQSAVLRRVNSSDLVQAACAMDAWRKSDVSGELEIMDALVRRRAAEKALFLKSETKVVSPSAFMRAKLDHAASILGAPVAFAQAPEVGSIPVAQPKAEAAQIIAEVLKSEPLTETLLLTQVAPQEDVSEFEPVIVTAHARPVARKLDGTIVPPRQRKKTTRFTHPAVTAGFVALFIFGAVLVVLGGAQLLGRRADFVDVLGAFGLAAPGVAAAFIASFGLWRAAAPTPRLAVKPA